MDGAEKSVTMMIWRQVLLLPHPSEATQVRFIVIKTGHTPPIVTSENVTVGVLQLSVAVAEPVFPGKLLTEQLIVTLIGQVMAGAWLSSTTIVCVQVLELPQSSVAIQVRVIVLSCGHTPATVTSEKVIVAELSQLSVAVAVPVFAGNVLAVHRMVIFAGQVMAGPWLSSTKMIWLQDPMLPQSSVAVHVRVIVLSCGHEPAAVTSLKLMTNVASQLSVAVAVPVAAGKVLPVH